MARRPRTDNSPPLSPDKKPWEPQPGEPAVWYTRFTEYLKLGPTRTMQRVRDNLCEETGTESYKCGGHWSRAAQQWRWQERARSWDAEQAELYAGDMRQKLVALQLRRFEIYADVLEMCMDNMRAANFEDMNQEEARNAFPQMARLMLKLLREERLECEALDRPDKVGAAITADDLIAAQRALEDKLKRQHSG
jgi:hypothetical protein